jgi:tripartite-type tricarboxylate transporter receptor subunit TctC
MKDVLRNLTLAVAAVGLCAVGGFKSVEAQEYPSDTVTLVVAFSPGGSSDTLARVLAPALSDALGQTVVVENRPGAGGFVAWRSIETADADGYTVLLAENALGINTALRGREEGFDPRQVFDAIGHVGTAPLALNVYGELGLDSVEEIVAYSQENEINYGSSGVGSVSHMTMAAVADATGIRAVHIPFAGGGELRAALLGGHTHISMSGAGGTEQMAAEGNVKAVAVGGRERFDAFPDVPTFTELGYETDVEIAFWWGLFVPTGTPDAVKQILEGALQEILEQPEVVERLRGIQVAPEFLRADAMEEMLDREITNWSEFVERAELGTQQ